VLRKTLATTNPIESALSVTRQVTARVTRWRDGDMRRRWCVAGLLRAESKFQILIEFPFLPHLADGVTFIAEEKVTNSSEDHSRAQRTISTRTTSIWQQFGNRIGNMDATRVQSKRFSLTA
jgi:hypothetical protein